MQSLAVGAFTNYNAIMSDATSKRTQWGPVIGGLAVIVLIICVIGGFVQIAIDQRSWALLIMPGGIVFSFFVHIMAQREMRKPKCPYCMSHLDKKSHYEFLLREANRNPGRKPERR